jgi:hypothetical protein
MLTVATFAVFFGIIAVANATGNFKYLIISGLRQASEKFNPDEIKGSSTYRVLVIATGIQEEAFIEEFGITPEMIEGTIKESGVQVSAVRDYIRELQAGAIQETESKIWPWLVKKTFMAGPSYSISIQAVIV